MKASALLLALAAAAARAASLSGAAPGKYIIEVAHASDIPAAKRAATTPHAAVYDALRARGTPFTVDREFNTADVFVGAAVTVDGPAGLAALQSTAGIVAITPAFLVPRPEPVALTVVSSPAAAAVPPDTESTHKLTGVDKLHAEGLIGTGIKVGIIDTGTDYTHPFLGGCFGAGCKVEGGYDFVGDAYTGYNTPVPDADPLDQCAGHGTHVAGIVGANPGNPFNISGVAYGATLHSYRIFGCEGSAQDDVIIAALLRGYNDGMNILTLSIGGVDGWTEAAGAVVASRIAAKGLIVTIAAGNDGADGAWYTSSPGTGLNVISVASTDNTVFPVQNATVHGAAHAPISYDELFPLAINGTLPVYATSLDDTVAADACAALPASTPNLAGYVVLIRRGTCSFVTKLANAAAFGAKYFLIDNNVAGLTGITVGNYTAALILPEDGAWLRSELAAGVNVSLSFPQTGGSFEYPDATGGLVSSYSTYGPTYDMFFKPAVAAPGGNILSTWPVPLGAYAVLSGTSMATPFMAGVSALLFEAHGTSAAVGLAARTLYESTAQPVAANHSADSLLQTLSVQGGGLVNAYKAVHATTLVAPAELLLNDTAHFVPNQKFVVTNTGSTRQQYALGHVPAGTAITVPAGDIFVADGPVPLVAAAASVKFSESKFALNPGAHATITAHFAAPAGLDPKTYPVYSGFITITSANSSAQVAYLGVLGSLAAKQVLDTTTEYDGFALPALVNAAGDQTNVTTYNFSGTAVPTVLYRLAFGTPKLTFDLVDGKTTSVSSSGKYSAVKTLGSLAELDYQPRNSDAATAADNGFNEISLTTPTFANGTAFSKGTYKVLLRAQRVATDATKEEDFESWLSPSFTYV